MSEDVDCSGVGVSGYWMGSPCGTSGKKFKCNKDGKWYCRIHLTIAEHEPERFARAIELREKQQAREEKKNE